MSEEMNRKPTELSDEEMGKVAGGNSFLVKTVLYLSDSSIKYRSVYMCHGGVTAEQFYRNYIANDVCGTACERCPNFRSRDNLNQFDFNALIAGLPGYERYDLDAQYSL